MGIHDGHREKMRRRYLETGMEGFADHEALELLLYYAIPRRDTNPIAHALMERYGSLSAVLNAPVEDLQKVEGIGESAAILLTLVPRISRQARLADAAQETVISSTERAGAYLLERFSGETRELVYLMCLDRKGKLLACKRLVEAGVIEKMPLTDTVSAVSAGIFEDAAVLDLNYAEDSHAIVDCNLIMTGSGEFVEIQGTGEGHPFRKDELAELLALGEAGNAVLCAAQRAAMEG